MTAATYQNVFNTALAFTYEDCSGPFTYNLVINQTPNCGKPLTKSEWDISGPNCFKTAGDISTTGVGWGMPTVSDVN